MNKDIPEITPTEAYQIWQSGEAHIIDVREPTEYQVFRIPTVRLYPMQSTVWTAEMMIEFTNKPLIVQCKVGGRSAIVAQALQQAGYTGQLYNLTGGILAWQEAGLPIET